MGAAFSYKLLGGEFAIQYRKTGGIFHIDRPYAYPRQRIFAHEREPRGNASCILKPHLAAHSVGVCVIKMRRLGALVKAYLCENRRGKLGSGGV